jgi:hypothetical protein
MTSDTCGPTSATPFASYDPESRSWRTSEATSLWALTLSSLTLPNWGCLHAGELSELPTPEPPTVGLDCSSLSAILPTPTARDHKDSAFPPRLYTQPDHGELPQTLALLSTPRARLEGNDDVSRDQGKRNLDPRARLEGNDDVSRDRGKRNLEDQISALLPTPVADHSRGLPQPGTDYQSLPNVAISLLPTPTVMDMGANYTPEEWEAWKARQRAAHANGNGHGASLTQEAISLLPTPRAQNGEERNAHPWIRPLDQPQNLENAVARIGASTPQPSTAGSTSSDAPHPAPPSPDATDDHDSTLF